MSNIDFSVKSPAFTSGRTHAGSGARTARQKVQMVLNTALIAAAFLFVTAAVLGIFP